MKAVIYARVSTKREEQKNSLENQLSLAEREASEYDFTIVDRYIDNGISGSSFRNRSEINRLLKDAKEKKFDVVLAKSVSRLGRNTANSLKLADELEKNGIRLILPEDDYDTSTSKSRFMFNLKAILAEEENTKLSERIKLGLRESAHKGKYKAPLPPYGYQLHSETKDLIVDVTVEPIVRKIFDMYLNENKGLFSISNYLMQSKIATPRSLRTNNKVSYRWHQSTLKCILTNPVYTGKLVYCREETTNSMSVSETYKLRKVNSAEKQVIINDTHQPIISEDEFQAVQQLMKKRGKNKSNGRESIFAHIAKCATCGSGMHFRSDRRNGAYVCGGYIKHTTSYCSSHIIKEEHLINMVKNDLVSLIRENVNIEKLYGSAKKSITINNSSIKSEIRRIETEIHQSNNRFDSLLTLHSEGALSSEQFKVKNSQIANNLHSLTKKKAELELTLKLEKNTSNQFKLFKKSIDRFAALDINDEKIFKQVIDKLVKSIEISEGEQIKIFYNLTPSEDLPAYIS